MVPGGMAAESLLSRTKTHWLCKALSSWGRRIPTQPKSFISGVGVGGWCCPFLSLSKVSCYQFGSLLDFPALSALVFHSLGLAKSLLLYLISVGVFCGVFCCCSCNLKEKYLYIMEFEEVVNLNAGSNVFTSSQTLVFFLSFFLF